jgi:hypothetical protein
LSTNKKEETPQTIHGADHLLADLQEVLKDGEIMVKVDQKLQDFKILIKMIKVKVAKKIITSILSRDNRRVDHHSKENLLNIQLAIEEQIIEGNQEKKANSTNIETTRTKAKEEAMKVAETFVKTSKSEGPRTIKLEKRNLAEIVPEKNLEMLNSHSLKTQAIEREISKVNKKISSPVKAIASDLVMLEEAVEVGELVLEETNLQRMPIALAGIKELKERISTKTKKESTKTTETTLSINLAETKVVEVAVKVITDTEHNFLNLIKPVLY